MSRFTIYIADDIADAYRTACDDAGISYSEAIRELIVREMHNGELFDEIDPSLLELAEKEAEQERIMAQQKLVEKKASFDDRIQGFFRKRLQGDAAYDPADMQQLAKGYKDDARNWFDDEHRIKAKCDLVEQWMQAYVAGYRARQIAEQSDTELDRSGNWFQVGKDISTLRDNEEEALRAIKQGIEREGTDPEAIIDTVASNFSVDPAAVEVLLSQVAPEQSRFELFVGESNDDGKQTALDAINQRIGKLCDCDQPAALDAAGVQE